MRTLLRAAAVTGMLAASVLLGLPAVATAAACYDEPQRTGADHGLLTAPIDVAARTAGDALALAGFASTAGDHMTTVDCG